MHSITVVFGPASLRFMFKSKEKAEALRSFRVDHPTQDMIIDDDFGQHAEIRSASIHGVIFEDMDLSRLAGVEAMLHEARTRAVAQQRAQSDSALRAANRGPSVVPVMTGGMNGMG
jgi:hypothetical protein